MTLAITHRDGERIIVDAVRERKPRFSPEDVVLEFAGLLKGYRITSVCGDRYAGEWPRERFQRSGIRYEVSERPKSDIYRDCLPLLNSGKVELLDHARLLAQFCNLERRTPHRIGGCIDMHILMLGRYRDCLLGPGVANMTRACIRSAQPGSGAYHALIKLFAILP